MSTKGDSMTNITTPSNSKPLQTEPIPQKQSPAFFRKSAHHNSNNSTQSLSNRDSFFSVKTPLLTEGSQPKSSSIASSSLSFTSRFDAKTPLRALTIDTASEASSFNLDSNHIGSYSATHNPANQHIHTGNSLISSLNGNLSAKHSRAFESYKRPMLTSPSKSPAMSKSLIAANFPFSTAASLTPNKVASVLGSNFANSILNNSSLLNSLSPTSLQAKKITNKSYSQDRYKPSSLYNYFDRKGTSSGLLRKSSNVLENSNNSDDSRSFNTTSNIENTSHTEKSMDSSLYGIFGLQKVNSHNNSVQATSATKFTMPMPNHEPTKCSVKRNGVVKAYAANTNQGIVRNYNEDRVSIILNIMKPASRVNEEWPKCSFFGVYDGHGGVACADFLRDNLHQYVIKEPSFPWNPKEALIKGFEAAEKAFLELAESMPNGGHNRSGSCALTALIVGDMCYVANVGDSRAVMSGEGGTKIYPLSKDHKPNEDNEQKRILEAGGKIYQSQAPVVKQMGNGSSTSGQMQLLSGPHRVFPGRLSVSRTFGDIEAKLPKYGGNPNVVVATPDIKTFRISPQHDCIILATDGIWDKLSSRDVIKTVWESTKDKATSVHHQCGIAVENILTESINRRTLDNITVVMICFTNFQQKLFPQENSKLGDALDVTQKDSDSSSTHQTSSVMESLKGSVLETEPDSTNIIKKEEETQNLQEKVNKNAEEKAAVVEKRPTIKPKLSSERTTNSVTQVDLNVKKLTAPLRESLAQQVVESKTKKENTKALPISDVNLLSKRLIAKKLNDPQKAASISGKLASQDTSSVQKLIEMKKKEAAGAQNNTNTSQNNKANILKN